MNVKFLLVSILLISGLTFGQQTVLKIQAGEKTKNIPAVERNGVNYVSVRQLAGALGYDVHYNSITSKLEIKFPEYLLKVTGSNQFLILASRNGKPNESYQMPLSSLKIKDDILIPLNFALKPLSKACGKSVSVEKTGDLVPESEKNPINISSVMVNEEFKTKKKISESAEKNTGKDKTDAKEHEAGKKVSSAYDITEIETDVKNNGTMLTVTSRKKIAKYNSTISDGVMYLNLVGVKADSKMPVEIKAQSYVKKTVVKTIGQNTQIELHLKDGYSSAETSSNGRGTQIYVSIRNKNAAIPESESKKDRWKLDVVVIDAGHGGKDPGAIGVGGQKEKEINLAIALQLGEIIQSRMPGVKVVYTRSSDKFVELYKRGKIANESSGKLFISIHCNSMPKKPSDRNGFEIYLLRPGRTNEAVAIAARENGVIKYENNPSLYRELTDDNFILVSMAHSSYMRHSEQFSDILNSRFKDNLSLKSNGIKQAGFYVLVGASMPSVLVETGFLSNKKDAEYLSSRPGQTAIAASLYSAIKAYKENYDKELRASK